MVQYRYPSQNSARPGNYILANLSDKDYDFLSRGLKKVDLPSRYRFASPGDRMEHIYFPTSGVVSTTSATESGESIEISMTGSEGLVGTAALLGHPELATSIMMQVAGSGMRASAAACRELLQGGGTFTHLVYTHISLQMLQMGQSALCNRLHEVKARLARWLLVAADRNHDDQLALTQEFLSQMLGARRSTVTVMAGELQRAGIIEYSRGKIRIIHREHLEHEACECYRIMSSAYQQRLES